MVTPPQLISSNGATLLRVSAGEFRMGSPPYEPGHRAWEQQRDVSLAYDYYLGKTPVTQAEYETVLGECPTDFPVASPDTPIDSVSWEQACEYCRVLTARDREAGILPGNWNYRLPTEAEWEYACRAGSQAAQYGNLDAIAWYFPNATMCPQPVAQKSPNAWGFYDMLGNVWEMCQDWFHIQGARHAARGGCYFNTDSSCRAAAREGYSGGRYCGFRLLAAAAGTFDLSPAVDELPTQSRKATIYDAILAGDSDQAARLLAAQPDVIESRDEIPPPLQWCIYNDKPQMAEWLLERGAEIERREQDQGATALTCAIVMRHAEIIRLLVSRGADTSRAMEVAHKGLAGEFEVFELDREGYREVVQLLRVLGLDSP